MVWNSGILKVFAFLFSYKLVDQFAAELADEFHRTASRSQAGDKQHKGHAARRAISEITIAARKLREEHKLGFLQRARLAQQVQNRLITYGYSVEVARETAYALSTAASR